MHSGFRILYFSDLTEAKLFNHDALRKTLLSVTMVEMLPSTLGSLALCSEYSSTLRDCCSCFPSVSCCANHFSPVGLSFPRFNPRISYSQRDVMFNFPFRMHHGRLTPWGSKSATLRPDVPLLEIGRSFPRPQSFQQTSGTETSNSVSAVNLTGEGLTTGETSASKYLAVTRAPPFLPPLKRITELPTADQAFYLLGFIAFVTTGALFALLATAIPTLNAMRRAAVSLERLADTAREELPGTMAAIRLSGMEISDLTLELSDISQDISEGVRSSARAVQAAEVGIRRIGALAASQTFTMLQEHASLPVEAVKPVVASAAETTWQAVAQAQRAVSSIKAHPVLSKWINRKNVEDKQDASVVAPNELDESDEVNAMPKV